MEICKKILRNQKPKRTAEAVFVVPLGNHAIAKQMVIQYKPEWG